MFLFANIWLLLSGATSICSAFSPLARPEMATFRNEHSFLLAAHEHKFESSRASLMSDMESNLFVSTSSRRIMIVSCAAFVTGASQVVTKANADVSDGNALPEGAQQFARTIKLKTDLKVWNRIRRIMKCVT